MPKPLFSIITVTYNAVETLPATLESVAQQTYSDSFEYLIVDGASSDGTLELVERTDIPGMKVVSDPDRGIYDAMNKGLDLAVGEYVIFLNAGDAFHSPDTLQRIADLIQANDMPGIVYGQTDIVDAQRRRLGPRHLSAPEKLTYKSFANGMLVCHQAMAVLKRITSPYDDLKYRFSADYDWAIRCLQHSRKNVYFNAVMIDYLAGGTTARNHYKSLIERFCIMSHYYGIIPTILRHFKFALRGLIHTHRL